MGRLAFKSNRVVDFVAFSRAALTPCWVSVTLS